MAWMVPGQNFDKYTYAAMLSAAKIAQAWSGTGFDDQEEERRRPSPTKEEPPAFDKDALLRLAQISRESCEALAPVAFRQTAEAPSTLAEMLRLPEPGTSSSASSSGALRPQVSIFAPQSPGSPQSPATLGEPPLGGGATAGGLPSAFAGRPGGGDASGQVDPSGFGPGAGAKQPKVIAPLKPVDISSLSRLEEGASGASASVMQMQWRPEVAVKGKSEQHRSIVDEALLRARKVAEANKGFYAAASEAPAHPPPAAPSLSELLAGQQSLNEPMAPALGELRAPVSARLRAHDLGMADLGLRHLNSLSRSRSRSRRRRSGSRSRGRGRSRSRRRGRWGSGSRSRSGGRRRPRIFSERPQPEPGTGGSVPGTGAASTRSQVPAPQPDGGFAVNRVTLAPQAGTLKRVDIQIPLALVRHFIGNKGATVRALSDAVGGGVSINVLPTVLPGGFKRIQVVGENWYQAQTLILAKLEELRQSCW